MEPIIKVEHLTKEFQSGGGQIAAVELFHRKRGYLRDHRSLRRGKEHSGPVPEPAGTPHFRESIHR